MEHSHDEVLGVLGGLGPQSTVLFYDLLTRHTEAQRDSEHLNIVISSHATTPDRTAYILGQSRENPLDTMLEDARKLVAYGATVLAIPCNTAHYFYHGLQQQIDIPILNIIEQTVLFLKECKYKNPGILGTTGTVKAGGYQQMCQSAGMRCHVPDEKSQESLMHIIYDQVKRGEEPDEVLFRDICRAMIADGCDVLIVGCTELSLVAKDLTLPLVDSLDVLAAVSIAACGKTTRGFDPALTAFAGKVRHDRS